MGDGRKWGSSPDASGPAVIGIAGVFDTRPTALETFPRSGAAAGGNTAGVRDRAGSRAGT